MKSLIFKKVDNDFIRGDIKLCDEGIEHFFNKKMAECEKIRVIIGAGPHTASFEKEGYSLVEIDREVTAFGLANTRKIKDLIKSTGRNYCKFTIHKYK
jgi:hypothetical protein